VSDEPLTRCIAELRRALGDSRQTPAYVQTIPKRGYRLLCAVTPLSRSVTTTLPVEPSPASAPDAVSPSTPSPTVAPVPARRANRLIAIGIAAVLVALVGGWAFQTLTGDTSTANDGPIARNTIAVLPFVSDAADNEYLGEGLADEILNRLSAVDGLRVVARTSAFAVRDSADDIRGIGTRLRVAHVLEGTVRRNGDQVRIDARLIDAQRGYQLWAANYTRVLGDIFALQDEIANTIVTKLRETVPTELASIPISTSVPTDNLAAYELWLRGRQFLHRREEESLRRSIRLFQQAIELDRGYGQAYVELAKAYALLPSYSAETQDEMFDRALATLAAGVEQDPTLDASMQSVLALISYARWDWIAAEVAFRRALELAHSDTDLYVWYSQFLSAVGQTAASAEVAERAKESDPLSPVVNHRLSVASMWIDADAEALRYSQIAEELGMGPTANPDAYIVLKFRAGDYAAIRPLLIGVQTMFAQPTGWVDPLLEALASPDKRPHAIDALAKAEDARDIPHKYLFGAWVYLGQDERALVTGLKLVNDRPSFNVEFLFSREARSLRAHPRFGELVRAIGLDRYWDQFGWPDTCSRNGERIVCG
jgi:serine/threonine-protein kinase